MKSIEHKATEYATEATSSIVDKYQTAPWNEFRDALAEIYLAGAKETLASPWRSPEELEEYECERVFTEILVNYHTIYKGRSLTLTSINDVNQWTDDIDEYHKGDDLIAWMPIPETPKPEEQ